MGQCYYINAKLKFRDEKKLRSAIVNAMKSIDCNWHLTEEQFNNFNIELLLSNIFYSEEYILKEYKNGNKELSFNSGFNQSYMWESLMEEIFHEITPALSNGSFLTVYPDNYEEYDRYAIKNMSCVRTH